MKLSDHDRAMLSGDLGPGPGFAMGLLVAVGEAQGAERLIDIEQAHVSSCYDNGPPSLALAERLAATGTRVRVPTTLTAGSVDLVHSEEAKWRPAGSGSVGVATQLVELHREMGCRVTMTCAPYHLASRPRFGDHVAWAESSAVVFANSVLGARTERYVEFLDLCAAIAGRVPDVGLHREENRRGRILFRLPGGPDRISERLLAEDLLYQVLGCLVGRESGSAVPVIEGLPGSVTEDQLRGLGAAAATTGSVAMFHAVGSTPEAPTTEAALGGKRPERTIEVGLRELREARDRLDTGLDRPLSAVCIGTPHLSLREFERLTGLVEGSRVHGEVGFYVSTSRHVLGEIEERGWRAPLEQAGVRLVVDTCTYFAPVVEGCDGGVMTNSAKWAYYAPGNLGAQVVLASLGECVRSAVEGRVWRDPTLWSEGRT